MKKHNLEWYITETDSYIYDEEVTELISEKLDESINTLDSIQKLVEESTKDIDSLPLTSKYLEYEELLSQIQVILECHFDNNR